MKRLTFIAACALCAAIPAAAQEEKRELGAHAHGQGRLNIAVEGKRLSMELEVPGADIVGFEHKAKTTKQKAAVKEARAKLAKALTLFKLSEAAGCKLAEAKIEIQYEGEEAGHGKHGHSHSHGHSHKHDAKVEGSHSEFHATYALDCEAAEKLTSIDFGYFEAFAGAQKLEVNLATPNGQNSYEVTRGQPKLELGEIG